MAFRPSRFDAKYAGRVRRWRCRMARFKRHAGFACTSSSIRFWTASPRLDDVRVHEIREHWRAIQAADGEEQAFCTLAGRMGIDPYDRNEMTDEVAQFLEQTVTSPEDPLVRDLTEVARPDSIVQQWSWLSSVGTDLELDSNPVDLSFNLPPRDSLPPQFGYGLARLVRTAAGVSLESPLDSVESVARDVFGRETADRRSKSRPRSWDSGNYRTIQERRRHRGCGTTAVA